MDPKIQQVISDSISDVNQLLDPGKRLDFGQNLRVGSRILKAVTPYTTTKILKKIG